MSLDKQTSPATIRLVSTTNRVIVAPHIPLAYRAELDESGTFIDVEFKLFIYGDCSVQGTESVFTKDMSTVHKSTYITNTESQTIKFDLPVLLGSFAEEKAACPLTFELHHNIQAPLDPTF